MDPHDKAIAVPKLKHMSETDIRRKKDILKIQSCGKDMLKKAESVIYFKVKQLNMHM